MRRFEGMVERLSTESDRDPTNLPVLYQLLEILRQLTDCHKRAGRMERVAPAWARSLRYRERVVESLAQAGNEIELVDKLFFLTWCRPEVDDPITPLDLARRAGIVLDHFTQSHPEDRTRREMRAIRLPRVAHHLRRGGAPLDEVMARADEARRVLEELIGASTDRPDLAFALFEAWEQIGKIHSEAERPEEAEKAWISGVAVLRAVVERAPDVDLYRHHLSERCMRLGNHFGKRGHRAEAERWFLETANLWPEDGRVLQAVARELEGLAAAVGADRQTLTPAEDEERNLYRAEGERVRRPAEEANLEKAH